MTETDDKSLSNGTQTGNATNFIQKTIDTDENSTKLKESLLQNPVAIEVFSNFSQSISRPTYRPYGQHNSKAALAGYAVKTNAKHHMLCMYKYI